VSFHHTAFVSCDVFTAIINRLLSGNNMFKFNGFIPYDVPIHARYIYILLND
jgi:hypothetical protein